MERQSAIVTTTPTEIMIHILWKGYTQTCILDHKSWGAGDSIENLAAILLDCLGQSFEPENVLISKKLKCQCKDGKCPACKYLLYAKKGRKESISTPSLELIAGNHIIRLDSDITRVLMTRLTQIADGSAGVKKLKDNGLQIGRQTIITDPKVRHNLREFRESEGVIEFKQGIIACRRLGTAKVIIIRGMTGGTSVYRLGMIDDIRGVLYEN